MLAVDAHDDDATACLTMILRYHRRPGSVDDVYRALAEAEPGWGGSGFTALATLRAAEHFGLEMKGLKIGAASHLWQIRRPAILHLRPSGDPALKPADDELLGNGSFAVLSHTREAQELHWIDPYVGRRRDSSRSLYERCTGVVLQFTRAQPLPRARIAR